MYLKELTELHGGAGYEDAVRDFIVEKIKDKSDELYVDTIGNLIAVKHSKNKDPKKVMVCAHMDEVALIVTKITDEGFLKFDTLGGIDTSVLVSKKVLVNGTLPGVIGAKAIHLQKKGERTSAMEIENLYIDIGAKDKKSAEKHVAIGDCAVFDSEYTEYGDGFIKAKALDDRLGCAALIELFDEDYDFDLYGAFTAQEETGLRGAQIAVKRICPDFALVLETTACNDTHGGTERDKSTIAGNGVVLSFADLRTYYDKEILKDVVSVAGKHNIPYQFKKTVSGGNDAGAIHLSCGGIKTVTMSVATRYIHSPSSVIKKSDYEAMKKLAKKYLQEVKL